LIRAGVEIREHDTIMLHSKVVIVDQNWAMVGSANIDERSFRLNFELTTLLYGPELTEQLYRDFEALRKQSRLATARAAADLPFGESLVLGLARLASPLL